MIPPMLLISKKYTSCKWKKIVWRNKKHKYLIYSWSDKALKGNAINWVFPFLHGGSIEITQTVPLIEIYDVWCLLPWTTDGVEEEE